MSSWIYATDAGNTAFSVPSGTTRNQCVCGKSGGAPASDPEANHQLLLRGTYTAKNLWLNVLTIVGTCTVRDRKNGANGGQTISITTTGTKEDTSGTTALATGDLFNIQGIMSGSHSDTCTFQALSVLLDDAGSGIPIIAMFQATTGIQFGTGAPFAAISGGDSNSTAAATEADTQIVFRAASTLSNFRIYIPTNSFTGTTTWRTRVNTSNGGQSISVASTSTGSKEDASGTDTIVAGDKVCWGKDSGGTANTCRVTCGQVKSTSAVKQSVSSLPQSAMSLSANTTYYTALTDALVANTSETSVQVKARVADSFTNLQCNVTANSRSDATTVDFRAGSASPGGGPTISIAASATGFKEDLVGSYTTTTTDLINYRLTTGAGTGTISLTTVGAQQGTVSSRRRVHVI